jgi:hypothetical protein
MVTFTSSSTVKNFKALIPDDMFISLLEGVTVASIGPITAETAKELGFNVHVIADEFTIPGLCKAIVQHYFIFSGRCGLEDIFIPDIRQKYLCGHPHVEWSLEPDPRVLS